MSGNVLAECEARGHEQVVFFNYPEVGLKAIVGIHNTVLGPGLGGCRMRLYPNEAAAIEDVMRLSEGMTYKSALAGLPLGGGKACIIADPAMKEGREALFKKFGECLNHLMGRYITAEDMGTSVDDMMAIKSASKHVAGTDPKLGGAGDPSPWTATGVFLSMQAAAERTFKEGRSLKGKRVAIQGVGHVGMYLLKHLTEAGAIVTVCDTNPANLQVASSKYNAAVVAPEAIYDVPCDIFAPCAVGQTVNQQTLPRLSCKIIAGAANNQLSDRSMYAAITTRGILYCPDFVINSGGVICVCAEVATDGGNTEWVQSKVNDIYGTTSKVLDEASRRNKFTEEVAVELAKEVIKVAKDRALK
jgi:leucine dehydrogenase